MKQIQPTRWFLGANSCRGFSSLYEGYVDPAAGEFLRVIKGGPGCGKSTLMKRIGKAAEDAGLPVEYIHCSGDPESLDAVWLPTLRTGYVDGTAPHVIVTEVHFPGGIAGTITRVRYRPHQNFQRIFTSCCPVSLFLCPISIFSISITTNSLGMVSSFSKSSARRINSSLLSDFPTAASSLSICESLFSIWAFSFRND